MKANTSSSREDSPDWLRCFQAPAGSALTLSSDSEPSPNGSSLREDTIGHGKPTLHEASQISEDKKEDIILGNSEAQSPLKKTSKTKSLKRQLKIEDHVPNKRRTINNHNRKEGNECKVILAKDEASDKHIKPRASNCSVLSLSSDSESFQASSPIKEEDILHEISSARQESQIPKKRKERDTVLVDEGNDGDVKVAGEETSEKRVESQACSSRLPLVLSEKVHRLKALVECEGEAIDMSGDMGAVGRVVISNTPSRNHEMLLDLKGTIFRTTIVPSRTFCVVSFGQSEAKVEAIMNDFIQLKPQSNVFETETMIEGTLDGFSFDSEDEADKMPKLAAHNDEIEGAEKQTRKTKGKAEKLSGVTGRRGKTNGGKAPLKKARKKLQVPKRAKTKTKK